MSQMSNGLKGAPQAAGRTPLQQRVDDRVEAVAIVIDRMPQRNESTRLGKEQKENPIEHRQRVLEEHTRRERSARRGSQGAHDALECVQHAVAKCLAYLDTVTRGECDRLIEKREIRRERLRASEAPERRLGEMAFRQHVQV